MVSSSLIFYIFSASCILVYGIGIKDLLLAVDNPKNVLEVNYNYYIFICGADEELENEEGDVGQGHRRHGQFPQQTHHEGVRHAQGAGDEILQYDRGGQGRHLAVKVRPPVHIGKHR